MTTKGNNMKQRIGFIGMGHMGSHMAQRLLEAGYQLAIYDRTLEPRSPGRPESWQRNAKY
jgi:3-hydroxyisobutyrate dehydrogenase-like beta-hydroxyacid dehydrogenase